MPFRYGDLEAYGLVPSVGFVVETSLALLKMISKGVFEDNRDLKVLMPHAGRVLLSLDGRLNENRKRLIKDASLASRGRVVEYLRQGNIWYDLANASYRVLENALGYFAGDKLLFASDYPFIDPGLIVDLIEALGCSKEEKEQIYWKNANALFDIQLS